MADDLQFLSWSRRGAGAGIPVDTDGVRRTVSLPLVVKSGERSVDGPSGPLCLMGPADIEPLSADFGIVRRSPRPGSLPVEPNLLACIEFDHPDVPWLFTPESVTPADKLTPWLMLVVVEMSRDRERDALLPPKTAPYQMLKVDGRELPDPRNAWAFAHVQSVAADAGAGADAVRDTPESPKVRSRLLCPTRLEELRRYYAALVPVYEAARRLGIGEGEVPGGVLLWNPADNPVLPVYDGWAFETGPRGDFEELARRLRPLTGAETTDIGIRNVAFETRAGLLQRQDDGEPEIYHDVKRVPTAITRIAEVGPYSPPSPTTDPEPAVDALHARLKQLVDIVAGAHAEAPIVGPPLYGQWHACVDSIDGHPDNVMLAPVPADSSQTWVEQLNADPFLRIAAGLGTRLIQRDQEEYVAQAWQQLADIATANRRTRWATMLSASTSVIQTKLAAAPAAVALRTMAPAITRLRAPDGHETMFAALQETTLPVEAFSAALTRTSRFAVQVGRFSHNPPATTAIVTTIATAFAESSPALLPTRFTTPRKVDPNEVGELFKNVDLAEIVRKIPDFDVPTRLRRITDAGTTMKVVAAKIRDGAAVQGPHVQVDLGKKIQDEQVKVHADDVVGKAFGKNIGVKVGVQKAKDLPIDKFKNVKIGFGFAGLGAVAVGPALLNDHAVELKDIDINKVRISEAAQGFTLGKELLGAPGSVVAAADSGRRGLSAATAAGIRELVLADVGDTTPSVDAQLGTLSVADSARIKAEVAILVTNRVPVGRGPLTPDTVTEFSFGTAAQMVTELTPIRTYAKLLKYANNFQPGAVLRRADSATFPEQLFPAMAAPLIQTALADRLVAMDPEWMLGGVSKLRNNSICLMEINRGFVEALLVGANHEFGRELLWRGHPTDLRGTSFPRFWNRPDAMGITPIASWTGDLGTHAVGGDDKDMTVVIIKGDLLRRYPNTLVSAEKGITSPRGAPTDFTSDGEVAKEWFRGFIGSDVTYSVLDISHERLLETSGDDNRHGWYISLLEPYDEPRFGLDEAETDTPNQAIVTKAQRYSATDTWTWQGLHPGIPVPHPMHLTGDDLQCDGSAAIAGASLLQRPFRLLLRAEKYLPEGNG